MVRKEDFSNNSENDEHSTEYGVYLNTQSEQAENFIMFTIDKEYSYLSFNSTYSQIIKKLFNIEIRIGMNLNELPLLPQNRKDILLTIDQTFKGNPYSKIIELSYIQLLYFESFYTPNFDSNGNVNSVTIISRDITERKLKENKHEYQNVLMESIIRNTTDAVFIKDLEGKYILVNEAATKIVNKKEDEILGKDDYFLFSEEDAKEIIRIEKEIIQFNETNTVIEHVTDPTGKLLTFLSTKGPVFDSNKKIIGIFGISKDITERNQLEVNLVESEQRLNRLFQNAPLGYQSLNDKGFIIDVNEVWLKTLGYRRDEVIGKWIGEFMDSDQITILKSNFVKFKEQGQLHTEYRMKRKDGQIVLVAFDGRISYNNEGKFERTHCIVNDITESKKAQQKIVESEERYRLLFSEMNQGIALYQIILDEDGVPVDYSFTDVNDYFLKMFDMTREDVIGKRATEVMPKVEKYWIEEFGKVALTGVSSNFENYFEQTGHYYSTHSYMTKPGFFAVLARDITESKKAEENILFLSYHDQLTGLYNRRFYEEELKRLNSSRNLPITLVMGDINGLKLVNDTFGHTRGDSLIKSVADAIKSACRTDDIVARLGGDEFVIILPNTDRNVADTVVNRIKSKLIEIQAETIEISVSFGYMTKTDSNLETTEWIKLTEDDMYRNKVYESHSMRRKTIDLIMKTLFEKNSREMLHSSRVSEICGAIASHIGLSIEEINKIKLTGLMHDIGKIGIDEKILNSNKSLTNDEWLEIKKHPEIGSRILNASVDFAEIAEVVLQHHERWDGKGYPRGLKGEEISINARIVTIADAYDAICSDRAYRNAYTEEFALSEIKKGANNQFDPMLVQVFIDMFDGLTNTIQK
ncbi:MAG TPA: PAS domain S-box protein [Erysipelotrichaceae bacterium]|nr:PAS domain S-box protein [Erysipelotrichaceae bacterium]